MQKNLISLLIVSVLMNFILGYDYLSKKLNESNNRLVMDLKCADFLPELKKKEKQEINGESITSTSVEVFFSPVKNSCLSIEKIYIHNFKEKGLATNNRPFEMWIVSNLLTNAPVTSFSWEVPENSVVNFSKQRAQEDIEKLKQK